MKKVYNGRLIAIEASVLVVLALGTYCMFTPEAVMAIFVMAFSVLSLLLTFCTMPHAFVFDQNGLTIRYAFGLKEEILWSELKQVKCFSGYVRSFTQQNYYIPDMRAEKRKFFMNGMVNKNRTTTALFQQYVPEKVT